MLQPFANLQKLSQDNLEATVKAASAFSAHAQAIANETAEFARKSLEHSSATFEKLSGAQNLETAIEVQTAYVKGAYESFIGQSSKMGALYTALATDTVKPFQGLLPQTIKA